MLNTIGAHNEIYSLTKQIHSVTCRWPECKYGTGLVALNSDTHCFYGSTIAIRQRKLRRCIR